MYGLLLAVGFAIGGLFEVFIFSRGEWDRRTPHIVVGFCIASTTFLIGLQIWLSHSLPRSLLETNVFAISFLGGLFSTMLAYRLVFHPLKAFPGPLGARITASWKVKESIPDLNLYTKLRRLHDHYGDFVRISPRELSIRHPDAIVDIHGHRNKIGKSEFYDQAYPRKSLQMNRDEEYHKSQRKHWDKAFHNKALKEYSSLLKSHYKDLLTIFERNAESGTPIDASNLLLDLFFDVISDLALGKSFDALKTGERNPIFGEFLLYQRAVGYMLLNMWFFYLLISMPFVQKRVKQWDGWFARALGERQKLNRSFGDIYTYISKSDSFEAEGVQEANLAVIAGADTNAITLSNACYLLCQHPEYQQKLYSELNNLPLEDGIIDDEHLLNSPYLNAIILETLRLYPPVPGGLQRVTPPQGAQIAGRYVPGNIIVSTPTWSIQRDPRAFVDPDRFIPERWSSQPELILRRDAFIAFGYGQYNCAGKPLAMLQMRMVLATMIRNFEMSIPAGKEKQFQRFHDDQADCFTLHLNPLPVALRKRERMM